MTVVVGGVVAVVMAMHMIAAAARMRVFVVAAVPVAGAVGLLVRMPVMVLMGVIVFDAGVAMRMAMGVMVVVRPSLRMIVIVPVIMTVVVVMREAEAMRLLMAHLAAAHRHLVGTSADRAHHSTSMSLTRISSPDWGISRPPPQRGHGARRSSISTVSMHS